MNVAWNKEVEQAVAVVIAPCCSGGPAAENDASLLGDISERAIVIIVVEAVFAVVGDVDVGPAVVVVVGDGNAETPAIIGHAGFVGDVGEGAVVIVVKEHGARRGLGAFDGGDGRSVK